MNQNRRKRLVGLMVIVFVTLLFSSNTIAGITIEEYDPKLNETEGVITKIEGNRLTLQTGSGKSILLKVKGMTEDKHLKLKLGDWIKIQNGEVVATKKLMAPGQIKKFDPQPEPPGRVLPTPVIEGGK